MSPGTPAAQRHLQEGHLWRRVAETAAAITALALLATSDALHGALLALFQTAVRAIETYPVAGPAAFVPFAAGAAHLGDAAGAPRGHGVAAWPARPRRVERETV